MARPLWKGAISFGLVTIPVNVYSATRRDELRFRQLDRRDNTPIQREAGQRGDRRRGARGRTSSRASSTTRARSWCSTRTTSARPTSRPPRRSTSSRRCRSDAVPPQYFEKPLYVVPGKGGTKPYHILRETLRRTGRVAIATDRDARPAASGRAHRRRQGHHARAAALRARDQGRERARGRTTRWTTRPRSRTRRSSSPSSWSRRSTSRGRRSSSATSTATTSSS